MKRALDLAHARLAHGALWVDYGAVRLEGIAVEAAYRPGPPARAPATDARISLVAAAIDAGALAGVHNGTRYALVGVRHGDLTARHATPRLVLDFRDATYAAFLATNGWDPRWLAACGVGREVDPRPSHGALTLDALLASGFLNCLGACLQVVARDHGETPWTYVSRRRGGIFDGYWDGSIDEGLMRGYPDGDQVSQDDPCPDLDRFVRRAVAEEAGLRLDSRAPVIVTAGHDTLSLQPALVGWVASDLTPREIRACVEEAPGRDEVSETRWIELRPSTVWEAVQDLKQEGRVLPWVEVGLYLTLLSHMAFKGDGIDDVVRLFGREGRGWPGAGSS